MGGWKKAEIYVTLQKSTVIFFYGEKQTEKVRRHGADELRVSVSFRGAPRIGVSATRPLERGVFPQQRSYRARTRLWQR